MTMNYIDIEMLEVGVDQTILFPRLYIQISRLMTQPTEVRN